MPYFELLKCTMKKTIIALIALSGLAAAEVSMHSMAESSLTQGVSSTSGSFADGTTYEFTGSAGKLWLSDVADTWNNAKALEDLNAFAGTSLTNTDINNFQIFASGAGTSHTTLTLNFTGNTSFGSGDEITLYVFQGAVNGIASGVSIGGLGNATYEYASDTGDGFSSSFSAPSGNNSLVLTKVTGTLSDTQTVTIGGTTVKTGVAALAYGTVAAVPEPATATLGLLALAGLAARRRRALRAS